MTLIIVLVQVKRGAGRDVKHGRRCSVITGIKLSGAAGNINRTFIINIVQCAIDFIIGKGICAGKGDWG